jgi:hypothetical protein
MGRGAGGAKGGSRGGKGSGAGGEKGWGAGGEKGSGAGVEKGGNGGKGGSAGKGAGGSSKGFSFSPGEGAADGAEGGGGEEAEKGVGRWKGRGKGKGKGKGKSVVENNYFYVDGGVYDWRNPWFAYLPPAIFDDWAMPDELVLGCIEDTCASYFSPLEIGDSLEEKKRRCICEGLRSACLDTLPSDVCAAIECPGGKDDDLWDQARVSLSPLHSCSPQTPWPSSLFVR